MSASEGLICDEFKAYKNLSNIYLYIYMLLVMSKDPSGIL